MTELRDLSRGSIVPSSSARYSRLEGTDDSIRIKVKTLDNESTWEVDGEGSWTVRQLKDHVRIFQGLSALGAFLRRPRIIMPASLSPLPSDLFSHCSSYATGRDHCAVKGD